jgi:hypothetical protein
MGKKSKRNARGAERSQQKALQKPSQEIATFLGEDLLTEAIQVKSDALLELESFDVLLGNIIVEVLSVVENLVSTAKGAALAVSTLVEEVDHGLKETISLCSPLAQKSSRKSVDNFRAKLTDLRDKVFILEEENKRLGQAILSWMELLPVMSETETARAQADYWMNAFSHTEEKRQGKGTCMLSLSTNAR